jgi:diguanylate cyclase (GGDEF)-like protein
MLPRLRGLAFSLAERRRLRHVMDSLPVVVLATDRSGRIVLIEGRASAQLDGTGLKVGASLFEVFASRPDVIAEARAALDGRESSSRWSFGDRVYTASSAPLRDLAGRIAGLITVAIDTTEQRRAERALAHFRTHDALTGLPDRNTLRRELADGLIEATVEQWPLAVLVIDIDDLKEINDAYGLAAGDAVLVQVARRLRLSVPVGAIVGRLDGDAFGVIVSRADEAGARGVALEMLASFEEPVAIESGTVEVSARVGIASFPTHGEDPETLLRRADIALDLARAGASRCATYAADRDGYRTDRRRLVAELRQAIDAGELFLEYQPIVEIASGRVEAVEALVRWQHPLRGRMAPGDFIELAERSGLIRPMARWVIRTALVDARSLGSAVRVSVNLSTHNLLDEDLVDFVEAELQNVDGRARLRVEVTEGTLMADIDHAATVLTRLRAVGVSVAIDDFGTGYSSLARLARLPVDEIKIDRSFIRELGDSAACTAIVRATVQLAHALDLRVVGEGVEDADALSALERLGCELAQGYFIARPMPFDDLIAWLARRSDDEPATESDRSS